MQEAEQLSLSGQEREEVVEATNRLAELKGAFEHGHS